MDNENNVNSTDTTTTTENVGEQEQEAKTYTEDEVRELLQKETDRRITSALKKQADKYERQLSLSKLDENSRTMAEKDDRIAELQAQLASYQVEKNKSELKTVLSARGLSAEFADLIAVTDDLEESQARIDSLDKLFKAAVATEVKKRLATNSPQVGTGAEGAIDFKQMSLRDRQKLFETNPDLYNKLKG